MQNLRANQKTAREQWLVIDIQIKSLLCVWAWEAFDVITIGEWDTVAWDQNCWRENVTKSKLLNCNLKMIHRNCANFEELKVSAEIALIPSIMHLKERLTLMREEKNLFLLLNDLGQLTLIRWELVAHLAMKDFNHSVFFFQTKTQSLSELTFKNLHFMIWISNFNS